MLPGRNQSHSHRPMAVKQGGRGKKRPNLALIHLPVSYLCLPLAKPNRKPEGERTPRDAVKGPKRGAGGTY